MILPSLGYVQPGSEPSQPMMQHIFSISESTHLFDQLVMYACVLTCRNPNCSCQRVITRNLQRNMDWFTQRISLGHPPKIAQHIEK